jgi:hypothetical protein
MHGSEKTRYEEFYGIKPDYKKLVMAPFGHPCIYRLPKEARPPGLSMKGRLGVYIGPSQSIVGGIMVYSFATKRVIDTATYRLLGAVPSAFTTYKRDVFVPSAADMLAILVDEDAPGIVTRTRRHREEEANRQMAEEDRVMNEEEVGDGEVVAAAPHPDLQIPEEVDLSPPQVYDEMEVEDAAAIMASLSSPNDRATGPSVGTDQAVLSIEDREERPQEGAAASPTEGAEKYPQEGAHAIPQEGAPSSPQEGARAFLPEGAGDMPQAMDPTPHVAVVRSLTDLRRTARDPPPIDTSPYPKCSDPSLLR